MYRYKSPSSQPVRTIIPHPGYSPVLEPLDGCGQRPQEELYPSPTLLRRPGRRASMV